jgi:ferredoxin
METSLLLNDGARLRLAEGACLPLRSDFGRCRACETVCPANVITVSVEQVAVAEGCLHCGRCVAACPTDALQLVGFEFDANLPAGVGPVEVECAKVPASARSSHSIEVPCLGALSTGRLARLHESAGDHGVALVDRGWCGQCKAGCGTPEHPARAAFESVTLWLESVHDTRPAPHWIERPLRAELMPEEIPTVPAPPDPGPSITRRQFFRHVAQDPARRTRHGTPIGGSGRAAFPASARREAPDRRRLIDALDRATERSGQPLPAEFFPGVSVTGACVDHRVCTAACPTGALKVVATEGAAALTFAAVACIGCGACLRACPESALNLEQHGGERAAAVIASHTQQLCGTCGEVFTPRAGESTCLACSKSQRFIGDAMTQLFGARN